MESLLQAISFFVDFMNDGGKSIMWPLFALNFLLWYALGYRYLVLKRGTSANVRHLIEKHEAKKSEKSINGILDHAIFDALKAHSEAKARHINPRRFVDDALYPYNREIKNHSILIKTIVILAPLIGLLGTVSGMIETFDALQSSSGLFGQGASISSGISKALFTTELGLVVAVPGIIIGKILDKKEEAFSLEFEQVKDIICTKDNQ
jgi:biopolymer transport protein ExbB